MAGLAGRLNDVMAALGGQPVVDLDEEDKFRAGDYGYRYLVRVDAVTYICTRIASNQVGVVWMADKTYQLFQESRACAHAKPAKHSSGAIPYRRRRRERCDYLGFPLSCVCAVPREKRHRRVSESSNRASTRA